MNSSRPSRLFSIKLSSKMPSSLRKGSCLLMDLLGSGGTIIYNAIKIFVLRTLFLETTKKVRKKENQSLLCTTLLSLSSSFLSHSKSEYRLRTLDSFSLKTGRFVWNKTNKKKSDDDSISCKPWILKIAKVKVAVCSC